MSCFGGPIIGADGFIGTTLLTGRGGAALTAGTTAGFTATATPALDAPIGAAGFAATLVLAAAGRSWTTFAAGFAVGLAGFAGGFRAATVFSAGLDPARDGFTTAFAGRFVGFTADFLDVALVGAIFFNGLAAAARAEGFRAFLAVVFGAGFFPAPLEFFLVTVFVAKVFSFGRSAAHLTLRRTDAAGCPGNTGPRQWVRGTA
jgi:hypothetical protein